MSFVNRLFYSILFTLASLVAALLPALKRSRRAACSNAAPGLYQLGYAAARYPRLLGVAAQARGRAR